MKETKTTTPTEVGYREPRYSELTTVAAVHTPNKASMESSDHTPVARVLDVAFADPQPDAVVVDLSYIENSPLVVKVKVETKDAEEEEAESPESFYTQMKRLGYCASPPDTPSGRSPPKKKTDTCPSDEKRAARLAVCDEEYKENAFAAVAPYFYHNGEGNPKQASKSVAFRKDKTNAADAHKGWKQRKNTPKPQTMQTIIAPDSKNKLTWKIPPPKPAPKKEDLDVESILELLEKKEDQAADSYKKSCWKLKDSAYKNEFAFKKAIITKKADVMCNRIANKTKVIVRGVDKEAEECFGDILMDIRLHLWNPANAKAFVNSCASSDSN